MYQSPASVRKDVLNSTDVAKMTLSNDIAFRIYQSILNASGDAVNLRDFTRYAPFFNTPSTLETFEGRLVIRTSDDLRKAFENLQTLLRDIGATQMERTCTLAQFDGPTTIRGLHDSQLRDDAGHVLEEYSGMATLNLSEGKWRVTSSQFVEEKICVPSRMVLAESLALGANR